MFARDAVFIERAFYNMALDIASPKLGMSVIQFKRSQMLKGLVLQVVVVMEITAA